MILRLFIVSSCLFYASRAGDKAGEGSPEQVTVPTILPQRPDGVPTPKRVFPTKKTEPSSLNATTAPAVVENVTLLATTAAPLSSTPEVVVKEESQEEETEEEQKPPPALQEEFVKVKEQPAKPQPPAGVAKSGVEQLAEPEDSNFLSFILVGAFLVVCVYLLQHNKKKILGLMFEGRNGRRNVRYRRLSQRDEAEQFKEDIIY